MRQFVSPAGNHLGRLCGACPGHRIADRRLDGAVRIGAHSRARHPRSHRVHPDGRQPRAARSLAILKPISAAVSIGTGGPFGAEGPIIMTGGAFGSMIAPVLSPDQRRAPDLAGRGRGRGHVGHVRRAARVGADRRWSCCCSNGSRAAAIPVALASATACLARRYILGLGPLFPVASHPASYRRFRPGRAAWWPGWPRERYRRC